MNLSERIALVTGAATGIGRATVLELARAGAAGVAINYRSAKEQAESLAEEVKALGVDVLCVHGDVRDDSHVRDMVRQTVERFGRLDILVNNAGITRWVPITDMEALTDEIWDMTLDVNVKGAYRCARAAAPHLKAAGGMIVNVSSISGVIAPSTMSSLAYGTAKAGLIYLTRGLAVALGRRYGSMPWPPRSPTLSGCATTTARTTTASSNAPPPTTRSSALPSRKRWPGPCWASSPAAISSPARPFSWTAA